MIKYLFAFFVFTSLFAYGKPPKVSKLHPVNPKLSLVYDVQEEFFSLDGIYYPYDKTNLLFPIELGDQFKASILKIEEMPAGGERTTISMTSPLNGKTQSFESIIINDQPQSTIITTAEKNRTIEKIVKEILPVGRDGRIGEMRIEIFWKVCIQYDVVLDDERIYEINLTFSSRDESKANEFYEKQEIQSGDEILWNTKARREGTIQLQKMQASIERNKERIFPGVDIQIIGFKRFSDKVTKYTFEYTGSGKLDRFGSQLEFEIISDLWDDTFMGRHDFFQYIGYRYVGKTRVFIFNFLFDGKGDIDKCRWCFAPHKPGGEYLDYPLKTKW